MSSKEEYTDEEIKAHFFRLYDQMPENYAILAKLRYDPYRAKLSFVFYGKGAIDNYHAIDFGFLWSGTTEDKFWYNVAFASSGSAAYPPIPESYMREIMQFKSKRDGILAEHSPAYISISPDEYRELKEKAEKYDKIMSVWTETKST